MFALQSSESCPLYLPELIATTAPLMKIFVPLGKSHSHICSAVGVSVKTWFPDMTPLRHAMNSVRSCSIR